jgi:hypothetical protein
MEFDPLYHFEALEVHLKTFGERQSHLLVKIWRKVESISPHPVSSRPSEPFGACFDDAKPVLTLFNVYVAKPRLGVIR